MSLTVEQLRERSLRAQLRQHLREALPNAVVTYVRTNDARLVVSETHADGCKVCCYVSIHSRAVYPSRRLTVRLVAGGAANVTMEQVRERTEVYLAEVALTYRVFAAAQRWFSAQDSIDALSR